MDALKKTCAVRCQINVVTGQLLTQQPLSSQINPASETPDKPMQITDEPLIIQRTEIPF